MTDEELKELQSHLRVAIGIAQDYMEEHGQGKSIRKYADVGVRLSELITAEQQRRATRTEGVSDENEYAIRLLKLAIALSPNDDTVNMKIFKTTANYIIQALEQSIPKPTSDDVRELIDLISDNTVMVWHSDDEGCELDIGEKRIIIQALEAYQPKEPCEWCSDNKPMIVEKVSEMAGFEGNMYLGKLYFCPVCGRALKGDRK
jgi:hypothetical protein